jgi:NAD(P)-dependent dehydrogenase (short-subunit alcohol dehydrogenase family)
MTGKRALVLGTSGGIGSGLVAALSASTTYSRIYAGSRRPVSVDHPDVTSVQIDLADEATLRMAAEAISAEGSLDLIIVATGLLHRGGVIGPEKSYRQLDAEVMAELFAVNSIGPAIAAKHFLPLLNNGGPSVIAFLSARVGSIGDNRLGGWHSYRASKAALNALVRCFSIEIRARNREAIAVALHPGTVDTPLSFPFQRNVPGHQLFSAAQSASYLLEVVGRLKPEHSGGFFAWDGEPIIY